MKRKRYRWVNVYSVERQYGGPEEGGWWYNTYEGLESVRVKTRKQEEAARARLEEEYGILREGDIYSARGGTDIVLYVERIPRESHDVARRYYC